MFLPHSINTYPQIPLSPSLLTLLLQERLAELGHVHVLALINTPSINTPSHPPMLTLVLLLQERLAELGHVHVLARMAQLEERWGRK